LNLNLFPALMVLPFVVNCGPLTQTAKTIALWMA
jgi:hypothetical protein